MIQRINFYINKPQRVTPTMKKHYLLIIITFLSCFGFAHSGKDSLLVKKDLEVKKIHIQSNNVNGLDSLTRELFKEINPSYRQKSPYCAEALAILYVIKVYAIKFFVKKSQIINTNCTLLYSFFKILF